LHDNDFSLPLLVEEVEMTLLDPSCRRESRGSGRQNESPEVTGGT
jgi:hypothetical protein